MQLVAVHRIWLVSPAYARSVEGDVPDGSLSNGLFAKAKRFAAHLEDILTSVTQSPQFLGEVAGDFAQAIRDHMPLIVGMVAGFITLEAASAFLATIPTGVSQLVAAMIQLILAAIGVAGMVEAGLQATQHGAHWLNLAWTAQGDATKLTTASKEFLKMLVALAMAALAYAGVKGNAGKALQIADSMPMSMPSLAIAGGGQMSGAGAGTAVAAGIPTPFGPFGTAMAMTSEKGGEGGGPTHRDGGGEKTPGGRKLSGHAEESLRRHGFREPFGQVDDIIENASRTTSQADGATVYIERAAGRGRTYNIAIVNELNEIVTAMRNLSSHELNNLGRNYGFNPNP